MISLNENILSHYEKLWSKVQSEYNWQEGPIRDLPDSFRILSFRKDSTTNVLITCGLSTGKAENRIEIFLYYPRNFPNLMRLTEILTITSHYHVTGGNLGLGHSVFWGEPIVSDSKCKWGYLSLPYLEKKELSIIPLNQVQILWLVPITEEEVEIKKIKGIEALESLFEERGLNYINFYRNSLVKGSIF